MFNATEATVRSTIAGRPRVFPTAASTHPPARHRTGTKPSECPDAAICTAMLNRNSARNHINRKEPELLASQSIFRQFTNSTAGIQATTPIDAHQSPSTSIFQAPLEPAPKIIELAPACSAE